MKKTIEINCVTASWAYVLGVRCGGKDFPYPTGLSVGAGFKRHTGAFSRYPEAPCVMLAREPGLMVNNDVIPSLFYGRCIAITGAWTYDPHIPDFRSVELGMEKLGLGEDWVAEMTPANILTGTHFSAQDGRPVENYTEGFLVMAPQVEMVTRILEKAPKEFALCARDNWKEFRVDIDVEDDCDEKPE
jgi:hypothetical protein